MADDAKMNEDEILNEIELDMAKDALLDEDTKEKEKDNANDTEKDKGAEMPAVDALLGPGRHRTISEHHQKILTLLERVQEAYPNVVRLGLRMRIEQITAIDTVTQSYTMRLVVVTDWPASDVDIENYKRDHKKFIPERIYNTMCTNAVTQNVTADNYDQFSNYNENMRRYNVRTTFSEITCTESFECQNFPFDVQDLSLVFDTDENIDEVIFVPSRYVFEGAEMMYVNKTYLALCDWDIVHYDVSGEFVDWKIARNGVWSKLGEDVDATSCIYFRIQVRRKAFGFCVRAMLWMFLLSVSSFSVFAFDHRELSDRLEVPIGLIFAIIAFQFIISSSIPNLPYLTIVDKYNLSVFIFVLLVTLESVVMGWKSGDIWEEGERDPDDTDFFFFLVMLICHIVFHVGFAFYVKIQIGEEDKKIGLAFDQTHDEMELLIFDAAVQEMRYVPWKGN